MLLQLFLLLCVCSIIYILITGDTHEGFDGVIRNLASLYNTGEIKINNDDYKS